MKNQEVSSQEILKNRERCRVASAKHYKKNKLKISRRQKIYRGKNKDSIKVRIDKWSKNNRIRYLKIKSRNRDKALFGGNKEPVFQRDNFSCRVCGLTNEEHFVINNNPDNLITLCFRCHGKKTRGKLNIYDYK